MSDDPPPSEATFVEHSPESANRRGYTRFVVELSVTLQSEHNFYQGFAENLSHGGLFVATHTPRPVGELLELSVKLPGLEEPVRCLGEVRWVRAFNERSDTPPGMGVKFMELSSEATDRIAEFLRGRPPLFFDDDWT